MSNEFLTMDNKKELQQTLEKVICQTEQALEEGWIYTNDYQNVLRSAKKSLPNQKENEFTYPDSGNGFSILRQ